MLKTHFDAVEQALLAMGDVSSHAGHPIHVGTPREWLLKSFLSQHLPSVFELGTGEIISAASKPGERRNQFDLVVHRREHLRLDYGGGIAAYVIEAVSATIEVKSTLTYEEFKKASAAARTIKALPKSIGGGIAFGKPPPTPVCYIVAFDGPKNMATVYEWIRRLITEDKFSFPELPPKVNDRISVQCPGIDAVFVLGKGFLYFDNAPMGWFPDEERQKNPKISWIWSNQNKGNLLYFFMLLNWVISGFKYEQINPVAYIGEATLNHLSAGT